MLRREQSRERERERKEGNGSESSYSQKRRSVERRKLNVDSVHHRSEWPHGAPKWRNPFFVGNCSSTIPLFA